jgi:prepilin-type N-terminal cleavage/methylation domain-containing protein
VNRLVPGSGRRGGRAAFTLIEILVVVAIVALALALAAPRIGRLPSTVQAEYCVSAVRTALDVASLRARTTGRPCRLVLMPSTEVSANANAGAGGPWWGKALRGAGMVGRRGDGASADDLESCTFVMDQPEPDALAQLLSGRAALTGSVSADAEAPKEEDVFGLVRNEFPLPEAVAFVFHPSGEAAGPALDFGVGKRHYRLEIDPLTGRADIRLLSRG